jgi:threonyl-tRNA synthetase
VILYWLYRVGIFKYWNYKGNESNERYWRILEVISKQLTRVYGINSKTKDLTEISLLEEAKRRDPENLEKNLNYSHFLKESRLRFTGLPKDSFTRPIRCEEFRKRRLRTSHHSAYGTKRTLCI